MTLKNVVDIIKHISLTQPNVNGVYEGSVYQINADPSSKYSNVIITQRNHTETEKTFIFNFVIFFCDRLVDDLESNRLQIQSNGISVLSNIFKTLENQYDFEILDKIYTTWSERFKDLCAGAFADVRIEVYKDVLCPELYE